MSTSETCLPDVLPVPVPMDDGMDAPHWDGLKAQKLVVQRCGHCHTWIWGPEHVCYNCLAWDPDWVETEPKGRVYAWTRVHTPGMDALKPATPYICVIVELPHAGDIRLIGNLIGPGTQDVKIGDEVVGQFEHHSRGGYDYTLLQWRKA